jgi:long-chain acyl-CoA synthetase
MNPTQLTDLLAGLSAKPTHPLLVADDTTLTNAQFVQHVEALASVLHHQLGLGGGEKVALLFANQPEFFISFFALRRLNAVVIPVNCLMQPEDVAFVLHHADIKAVLGTYELVHAFQPVLAPLMAKVGVSVMVANTPNPEALPEGFLQWEATLATATLQPLPTPIIDPNALALMLYTSGTTGQPKGVMLSEANVLSNLAGFSQVLNFAHQSHCFLLGLPLFHCYGLMCGLYALHLQATIVLVPKFNPKRMVALLTEHPVTVLALVPTMFTLLLTAAKRIKASLPPQQTKPFVHLNTCISGGAALAEPLLNEIQTQLGITVLEGYGLTESTTVIAVNTPAVGAIASSVGKPLPNLSLRLVNPETQGVLPLTTNTPSEEGEIQVKGPNIMLGYYKNPAETQATITADGWLKTGDLGRLDAQGNLFISGGRLKDLIIRAGENVAPLPIERVLAKHPLVAEVAVIPLKDGRLGEAILACVQLHEPPNPLNEAEVLASLKAHAQAQLPPSYVPDSFKLLPELPKNPTGKIVKKKLIALFNEALVS